MENPWKKANILFFDHILASFHLVLEHNINAFIDFFTGQSNRNNQIYISLVLTSEL